MREGLVIMRKGGPRENIVIWMSCRQNKILFGMGKGGRMVMVMIEMNHRPEMEDNVKWQ
jgi:hypothetical protein